MLLSNHGYDPKDPSAFIPDDLNPLIFFNTNKDIMISIFGDDQN